MNTVQVSRSGSHRRPWRGAARLGLVMAALSLVAASCGRQAAPTAGSAPVNSLSIKACTVDGMQARCGTLIVPENRLTGKGRTIPVRFVVIPAFGADRAPDPVVYFAGGPGGSAVAEIRGELPDLQSLNTHRDLVFIEQRGTGQSSPLTCPAFPGSGASTAKLRAAVRSCLAHLRGDLRFYTTAMYADDVSQVLRDLHYGKVNLMGISYGTAVEQVFQLRHPGQVRTMTMQSGSPLSVRVIERAPGNSQRALDYVIARCASQPGCHRAFPHLAADWARLWASLGRSPWVVPAAQSPTKHTQRITQDDLASSLYEALYGYQESMIPAAVHTLATAADKTAAILAVWRAGHGAGSASTGVTANLMMPDMITCAEPWASDRPAALSGQRSSFAYHMFLVDAQWWQTVCPLIPKSAAAVGDLRLRPSRVPVLAFNGAGDPIEQPQNWAGARKFWPDSRELALPGQGHDVDSSSWQVCAGMLTQKFIERASVAHLNTGCLAYLAPPFQLTLR
jgi:pimeloyl-ACP methyl ester carboxylesterase